MKDTLEDFEKFVIDVIIHNRRGIRANLCRGIFWCLSKVYSRVVESRLYLYRERFDRQKLVNGLLKACEKRPVSLKSVEAIADRIESMLQDRPEREIGTVEVGTYVMEELKKLDKVAYVRFASVYRHFRDIGEFMDEIKGLVEKQ